MTLHTTGKMTWHESTIEANVYQLRIDGHWLLSVRHNGEQMPEKQRENMRRLAACWNACEGIRTEVLEANQSGGLPWNVADQIEARVLQGEMLEALQKAVAEAKPTSVRRELRPGDDCTLLVEITEWADWIDEARAAIAKATGSPT